MCSFKQLIPSELNEEKIGHSTGVGQNLQLKTKMFIHTTSSILSCCFALTFLLLFCDIFLLWTTKALSMDLCYTRIMLTPFQALFGLVLWFCFASFACGIYVLKAYTHCYIILSLCYQEAFCLFLLKYFRDVPNVDLAAWIQVAHKSLTRALNIIWSKSSRTTSDNFLF